MLVSETSYTLIFLLTLFQATKCFILQTEFLNPNFRCHSFLFHELPLLIELDLVDLLRIFLGKLKIFVFMAATGRVTIKVDVFAFGVVLMEMITGRKSLDESLPEEKSHLVTWFRRVLLNQEKVRDALDPTLNPDEETFESICKVAELAGHCTAREPYQRPDMSHAVSVLSHLLDEWKPAADDEEDISGFDGFYLSLPQAMEKWQATEGTSSLIMDHLYDSGSHSIPRQRPASYSLDQL